MTKKQLYETPEVELLEVKLKRSLLLGSNVNSADNDYDNDNDLGEI